ncbi:MAG: transketolase [Halobacteria archaeon]|nr:transketolase [Halobacteria archaeon]
MTQKEKTAYENYEERARQTRKEILKMTNAAGSGHPGGSLSATEMLIWLYNEELDVDPENPDAGDRDRLIYSKGHACPAYYSVLARQGFFSDDELMKFRGFDELLQGHSSMKIPGVDFSSGSLGQGLSFANGIALAGKLDGADYHVYAMLGDGEVQEGAVWEAAMTAGDKSIDNLTVVVDNNGVQNDRPVEESKTIEPLDDKFESFGWYVTDCDGHDFDSIREAFEDIDENRDDEPAVVISHSTKGKGISFMEEELSGFHGKAPNDEQLRKGLRELGFEEEAEEI